MVSILTFLPNIAELVNTHDGLIKAGEAQLIDAQRFVSNTYALEMATCRMTELAFWAGKNQTIGKPALHLMLSFHPSETGHLTNATLCDLADQFYNALGFTHSPYLLYRRDKHPHLHIHLVSVALQKDGLNPGAKFLYNRCEVIRKRLEKEFALIQASGRREWREDSKQTNATYS